MNANTVNELTQESRKGWRYTELDYIFEIINVSASHGRFSCVVERPKDFVDIVRQLRESGYRVDEVANYLNISWKQ